MTFKGHSIKSNNSTVHFQAAKSSISKQILQTQTVIAYLHNKSYVT